MPPLFVDRSENSAIKQEAPNETLSKRAFGTNLTNAPRPKVQFCEKAGLGELPATPQRTPSRHTTPSKRVIFSERSPIRTPKTRKILGGSASTTRSNPIVFSERRPQWFQDGDADELDSPPSIRIAKGTPSLGSLIRTRRLELKTRGQIGSDLAIEVPNPGPWQEWNSEAAVNTGFVLLNPHKLPLDQVKFVKYADQVLLAVANPSPRPL